ncbi:hypothetical protein EVAR_25548_1 [Eumeta japonica]|uniref:Mariner Mos1 transposase n=1 Tax=Eumeta variegata TaxID=151549 RepID=A0A4C1Z8I9_EUMVA|nr:hypothetical protein EVAR_25548_1 [Eumeta japonica]
MIEADKRVTNQQMRTSLGIGISLVHKIFHDYLAVRKSGDEGWIYCYNPETKRQYAQCVLTKVLLKNRNIRIHEFENVHKKDLTSNAECNAMHEQLEVIHRTLKDQTGGLNMTAISRRRSCSAAIISGSAWLRAAPHPCGALTNADVHTLFKFLN